jgi:hypothetical protein
LLAILEEMKAGRTSDYLFPGRLATPPPSPATAFEIQPTPRTASDSSFRDWAGNETHYPRDLAEHALLMSSAIKPNKPTVDRTRSRSGAN